MSMYFMDEIIKVLKIDVGKVKKDNLALLKKMISKNCQKMKSMLSIDTMVLHLELLINMVSMDII